MDPSSQVLQVLGAAAAYAARINITVYLKTSTIIVNHPRKDHVEYRIRARQIGGPAAAWVRGKAIAIAWAAAPREEGGQEPGREQLLKVVQQVFEQLS